MSITQQNEMKQQTLFDIVKNDRYFLKQGDLFLTQNPMALGRIIVWMERSKSLDNEAKYSHAGLIVSSNGDTFEALQTIRNASLFKDYRGKGILIARYREMTDDRFRVAYDKLYSKHNGQKYPFYRLFQHLFGLAKVIHQNHVVCSELVAKFLNYICRDDNIYDFNHWYGFNPDNLHDIYKRWKNFDIIFEGVC